METIGLEITDEPGSLVWTDARLTDPVAGRQFYAAVFGYTYGPLPGAPEDYSTFLVDGRVAGGMGGMFGAAGRPAHWLAYFSVDDVDATAADALAAGGTVIEPRRRTPGSAAPPCSPTPSARPSACTAPGSAGRRHHRAGPDGDQVPAPDARTGRYRVSLAMLARAAG